MKDFSVNPAIFRGYDIRGVVGRDLNASVMEILGKAYGTWLHRRKVDEVVIGADVRPTSEEYKQAVISGLLSTGRRVIDIGVCLSAMDYWAQYEFKVNGGVMVTASHNSLEYNGLKLASGFSRGMTASEVQEIAQLVREGKFSGGEGQTSQVDIREAYFFDLLKRVHLKHPMKVVVDTANGTPGLFVKELLTRAGCAVYEYHTKVDASMPLGTPDPTDAAYLTRLSYETGNSEGEIGLAFDTDGDRFGVVDEKGQFIWNDVVLTILALDILERIPGAKIVYNALCSRVVKETVEKVGGEAIMTTVGHTYVERKMSESGAIFGGELSGHFYFADNFYSFDDGFFSVLRLLDYLARQKQTLSELVAGLPKYIASPEIKLGITNLEVKRESELKERVIEDLSTLIRREFPSGQFSYIDGIRVDFPDMMLIARSSQNGPYLTVRFEAKSQEKYEKLKIFLTGILRTVKEINWEDGVNQEALS